MPRYMTRDGFDAIQKEIHQLWHDERPRVVREVSAAAELGDRSENAEYIYGKKRLRQIDSRLEYLRRKVDGVRVVDPKDQKHRDRVDFGAIVTVEDEDGNRRTWRLVDKDEADPAAGRISVQSPVGSALLGKKQGDEVSVRTPKGEVDYEIIDVRYGEWQAEQAGRAGESEA
jgi:transcription elongation factor GreB